MKATLCNAFSLSMLSPGVALASVGVQRVTPSLARETLARVGFESAVGHATTAAVMGAVLGVEVTTNRVSVRLEPGGVLVVAQFTGTRLPEGATTLPEGAELEWFLVRLAVLAEGGPFEFPGKA